MKISKKKWGIIASRVGWYKVAEKVSNCCGVSDRLALPDGTTYSDLGMCPKCKEHCEFEELDGLEES